ncbi:hypothetical protein DL93DRAFT_842824 [Clavulina sp. PMI_390]|nr:hypothetical protein DL93DRAFT_842824 [Clavulina sp. PMI_390]
MSSAASHDLDRSVSWASSISKFPTTAPAAKANKKRRVQRACDDCRRRKIRCDAPLQRFHKGGKCSNCAISGSTCTFVKDSVKRGPSKAYVEGLEHRLATIEDLVRKLALRVDIQAELAQYASEFPSFLSSASLSPVQRTPGPPPISRSAGPLTPHAHDHPANYFNYDDEFDLGNSDSEDDDEDPLPQGITKTLEEFNISETTSVFHGKSSGFGLLKAATLLKKAQGIQPSPNKTSPLANDTEV